MAARKRHEYHSEIEGYRVHVTFDNNSRRTNAEVWINKLHRTIHGDTWLDAIRNAREVIKAAKDK